MELLQRQPPLTQRSPPFRIGNDLPIVLDRRLVEKHNPFVLEAPDACSRPWDSPGFRLPSACRSAILLMRRPRSPPRRQSAADRLRLTTPIMPPPRVSGARLDAFVQQAREPVFLLSPDRRFLLVNRAWEELTGHTSEEVTGRECHPHGPTRAGDLDGLGGSFCPPPEALNGQPSGSNTLIIRADGERRWRRIEFWPFHDAQGVLTGLIGLVRPRRRSRARPRVRRSSAPGRTPDGTPRTAPRSSRLRDADRPRRRAPPIPRPGRRPTSQTAVPVLIVGEPGTGKLSGRPDDPSARASTERLALWPSTARRSRPKSSNASCSAPDPDATGRPLLRPSPTGSTLLIGDILDLPRDLQARLASSLDGRVRLIATTDRRPRSRAQGRTAPPRPLLRPDDPGHPAPAAPRAARRAAAPRATPPGADQPPSRRNSEPAFTEAALDALAAYDWPANLRELARVIEEAHTRAGDDLIQLDDIPAAIRGHQGGAYNPPQSAQWTQAPPEGDAHPSRTPPDRASPRTGRQQQVQSRQAGAWFAPSTARSSTGGSRNWAIADDFRRSWRIEELNRQDAKFAKEEDRFVESKERKREINSLNHVEFQN